jgi:hypothetical protein
MVDRHILASIGVHLRSIREMTMKKLYIFLFAALILFSTFGIAAANTYFFNFEDGTYHYGPLSGLESYMEGIFGSDVDVQGAYWWGNSLVYDSDILYTKNASAVLDFDPLPSDASSFRIQSVSFKWLVLDATNGIDFGLDVFDDVSENWIDNFFHVNYTGNFAYGETGTITFNNALEITRLRIHDCGILDVGMDNLALSTVPIPGTLWIFGAGIVGLVGIRRKLSSRIG